MNTEKNGGLNRKKCIDFIINNIIYFVLLLLVVIIIVVDNSFLSMTNFKFIITQASTRVILALGVAGLLVLAGTDLSVGRMVGLSAVISASFLQAPDYARRIFPNLPEIPIIFPILLAILCTTLLSTVSGYIIAKFKVTAFIVTLGMQLVIYGLASLYYDYTGGSPIANLSPKFKHFAQGNIDLGFVQIPFLVIYAMITVAIVWFIWNKTRLGKNMFAVGGNEEAANVSGVNVTRTIILVSVLAGILYGFAGSLEVARTGSATNNIGNAYELDAIAACVVGGVSFNGGIGSIAGVVGGVFMFQIINYGLNYIDVSPYIQYIIKGLIIVVAVAIDNRKYIKKK